MYNKKGVGKIHTPKKEVQTMAGNSSTRAKNKYAAKNYDNLRIIVPKGNKATIKAAADRQASGSINGYVNMAINERLEKDGFEPMQKQENKEILQ